jgi:capsular exopolysaccharide synthesis family protein
LSKQAKLDELVTKTEVENLCFVSAGVIPHNPSELLLSTRVEEFIETAKKKFDLILFDTPPSAIVTDAIILSRLVDNVIVVVQSGRTSKRALSRMYKTLKDSTTRLG